MYEKGLIMLKYKNYDWLYKQYITQNRTIDSIRLECGVSHQTIERYLKKYNIRKTCRNIILPSRDELIELHTNRGIGIETISKLYPGVGVQTIKNLMTTYNIKILNASELHKKWWSNPENKQRMSELRLKLWKDDNYLKKTSAHLLDKEKIKERSIKFSAKYQGLNIDDWTGFITPQRIRIRQSSEYKQWRSAVFKRDNYICQCCGARNGNGHKVILHAHHLECFSDNPELRFDINNGITLCFKCHDIRADGSFHNIYGVKGNTRAQYNEYDSSCKAGNLKRVKGDLYEQKKINKFCGRGLT